MLGNCVCFNHAAAVHSGVHGNPNNFLSAELHQLLDDVRTITSLSPNDANGKPTLAALGWMDVECPFSPADCMKLVSMIFKHLRGEPL